MNKLLKLNPQLFADEGATGFAAGSAEAVNAETGEANSQVAADTGTDNGSNVDAGATDFQTLINGQYKAEYQSAVKKALSKRMKTNNQLLKQSEEFKQKVTPILERLGAKYGADPEDLEAIIAAAEEDDSYFENYAMKYGVDVQTAKKLLKADQLEAQINAREAEEALQAEFNQKYAGWLQEAEALQQYYPDFDFERESANEETGELFIHLLNCGIPIQNAYETIHIREFIGGAMQYAYNASKQEMADARTARQNRPAENGTSSQQASTVVNDMTKMSKADRQKIKAAVSRGEKVTPENFNKFL